MGAAQNSYLGNRTQDFRSYQKSFYWLHDSHVEVWSQKQMGMPFRLNKRPSAGK